MACIPNETAEALMQSIEADRLVIVCGAGLSMANPSRVPSAKDVANQCYDAYELLVPGALEFGCRDSLSDIAEHFVQQDRLQTFFLPEIVPWKVFVRQSNRGHAAIADMILSKSVRAALTTNYDWLVEQVAQDKGAVLDSALDGDEAASTNKHSPYLKLHGCAVKKKCETVWATSQIEGDASVVERITKTKRWLEGNLREKDFAFVGFWSDWDYLNTVIESALGDVRPLSVTLVDPASDESLRTKAPALWTLLNREGVSFKHLPCSGDEFLDELRCLFSRAYLRRAMQVGRAAFEAENAPITKAIAITMSSDTDVLYAARCDTEGVPRSQAATKKSPDATEIFAMAHFLLNERGAIANGADYEYSGQSVRIINGAGSTLNSLKHRYSQDPASIAAPDVIICAGSLDNAVPEDIVRQGRSEDIVRPTASGHWLTLDGAREHFAI